MPFDGGALPSHLPPAQCLRYLRQSCNDNDNLPIDIPYATDGVATEKEVSFTEYFQQYLNFVLIKNLDITKSQKIKLISEYPWKPQPRPKVYFMNKTAESTKSATYLNTPITAEFEKFLKSDITNK
jgi:hypothetical protein